MKKILNDIKHADAFSWLMSIIFILWIVTIFLDGSSGGCTETYTGYDTGWSEVCVSYEP
jgi:hypothetical protein